MNTPTIDTAAWHAALPHLPLHQPDRLLVVQCSLDWLRPTHQALREEIDDLVLDCAARLPHTRIDRLVLHSVPASLCNHTDEALPDLIDAHAKWLYRLSCTQALLHHPALHIHRLIVGGTQQHPGVDDLLDLQSDGAWLQPAHAHAVLQVITGARRTTPLTGYDLNMDGPFGDADPSIYL